MHRTGDVILIRCAATDEGRLCYLTAAVAAHGTSGARSASEASRLRVTVLGPAPPLRGGIAHYTVALARALQARHEVQVIGLRRQYPRLLFPGTTEYDDSHVAMALPVAARLDPLTPWTWRGPAATMRAFAPDVIVLAWWQPALGAVLATFLRVVTRQGDAPLVFLCHNLGAHEPTWLDRLCMRWAFAIADGAVVHSPRDLTRLHQTFPQLRTRHATHPAYDLAEFGAPLDAETARARLNLHGPVILFFGLIRAYKGLDDLLQAMPAIRRHHDCTLVVAGEFYEDRRRYDEAISRLGLQAHVRIVGRYVPNEEVAVYFSAADVVVAPYRAATQSGVVALAQRFQRPVVVTRAGGLPEMIHDGVTGIVVPPADPPALAAAVRRIYDEGVSTWCRRVAETRGATWEEEIDAIEHLARR